MASDFVPSGWRVPTEADWDELLAFLGGQMIAGGAMKEVGTSHWLPPNTGAVDSYGFRALPGGKFDDVFAMIGQAGLFWIADEYTAPAAIPLLDKDGNEYTTIIIGSQEWIIENLKVETYADGTPIPNLVTDAEWIGSNVTKETYGALYNWYAATYNIGGASIAPTGWHVPTGAELNTLIAYLGGWAVAGGKLKEIGFTHWESPNLGATNETGFNGIGGGSRGWFDGLFAVIKSIGAHWLVTENPGNPGRYESLVLYNSEEFLSQAENTVYMPADGHSIRCLLDGVDPADPGTVTDIDGNVYPTVKIGTQVWMAENLKVTKYNNGTDIPIVTDNTAWAALVTGAMCYYNNDVQVATDGFCYYNNDEPTYKFPYGALYNKLAVDSAHLLAYLERSGVQEVGWRVPSEADIDTLIAYLGGLTVAGGKLKQIGTTLWNTPNTGATNESGFTAIPSSDRLSDGTFDLLNIINICWSITADGLLGVAIVIQYDSNAVTKTSYATTYGLSVRLMRDTAAIPPPVSGQYTIFTDGISTWRIGVRGTIWVLDKSITALGFAGAENIDWVNVTGFS